MGVLASFGLAFGLIATSFVEPPLVEAAPTRGGAIPTSTGPNSPSADQVEAALDQAARVREPRATWTEVIARSGGPVQFARGVSCPTETICFLAADRLRRSSDGGRTWQELRDPVLATHRNFGDIDCVSAQRCTTVGQFMLSTADGGATWTTGTIDGLTIGLLLAARVSCPTEMTCFAIGFAGVPQRTAVLVTHDGGATWTRQTVPFTTEMFTGLSCPTDRSCRAVASGELLRTDDGGATWSSSAHARALEADISCPSVTTCVSVAGSGSPSLLRTLDGGATWDDLWMPHVHPTLSDLRDVDCVSTTRCVAVGTRPANFTGVAGAVVINPTIGTLVESTTDEVVNGLSIVDCAGLLCVGLGVEFAVAGRFATMTSSDGGAGFATVIGPSFPAVADVACSSAQRCIAVGRNDVADAGRTTHGLVRITTDSGLTWTTPVLPASIGPLATIACSTDRHCVASGRVSPDGGGGILIFTLDGGATWAVGSIPIDPLNIYAVTCPSEGVCLAGANVAVLPEPGRLLRSTTHGATWTVVESWPSATTPIWVACSDASRCVVIGRNAAGEASIRSSLDSGLTWTVKPAPATGPPQQIRCASSECLVLFDTPTYGEGLFATSDLGSTWTPRSGPPTVHRRCGPSGLCLALINPGAIALISADGGSQWTHIVGPGIGGTYGDPTCPTESTCFVTITSGAQAGALYRIELSARPRLTSLVATPPARLLDSRPGGRTIDGRFAGLGTRQPGARLELPIAGRAGVPLGANAAVLNLTATDPSGGGYATVWPCDSAQPPNASSLNFVADHTVANLVVAPLSPAGTVCLQVAESTTNLIADVNGYLPAGSTYAPLSPTRLLDTRPGGRTVDQNYQSLGSHDPDRRLELLVAGRAGVPASAVAAVLNVTATDARGSGYVTVWPCDAAGPPNASSLNFTVGETVPNLVIVPLSQHGYVCMSTAESSAHLIADISGYVPSASSYEPVSPARLLDTRAGGRTVDSHFSGLGLRPAGTRLELQITGRAGVEVGSTAAVINLTVAGPIGAGFVTAWPCDGEGPPNASNLNFDAGETVANLVIAPLSASGAVCLHASTGTHLIADLSGYFPPSG